jgi:TIR domain/Pentapeptide repeats (8 copies)
LKEANLCKANLSEADLSWTNLFEANLKEANLSKADLSGANLWNVILDNTIFQRAIVGSTIFGGVDLSSCSGLDLVEHEGPSTLGVDSIIHSKGRIPESFLRGVGLPDDWINYIPSLVGEGIQFFSCFISYSSMDKAFAVRLHDALQSKGIRCWLDEKQLLPGHDISRELERGIYSWDKFLLCASKNSLTSWWVDNEIKTTFEKERALRKERGKPILKLIPLNLDGYMFTAEWDLGVLANEIRGRVAADFRDWQTDDAKFNDQVNRVIKALRTDEGAIGPSPPSRL